MSKSKFCCWFCEQLLNTVISCYIDISLTNKKVHVFYFSKWLNICKIFLFLLYVFYIFKCKALCSGNQSKELLSNSTFYTSSLLLPKLPPEMKNDRFVLFFNC